MGSLNAFQLTRPMRGATFKRKKEILQTLPISTHTPHAGRNHLCRFMGFGPNKFQLTRPMRGATYNILILHSCREYFNSHAPCGAQLALILSIMVFMVDISTHTPHAGRNNIYIITHRISYYFNSHAPCGAQHSNDFNWGTRQHFNSHAPCGAQP